MLLEFWNHFHVSFIDSRSRRQIRLINLYNENGPYELYQPYFLKPTQNQQIAFKTENTSN